VRDPRNIATVYYNCSQSNILDDFKETNRKRITRYECKGQLIVRINIADAHAHVHMRHALYHERPDISIGVSSEVVSEIRENCHLDPLQLRTHLAARFDIKDMTAKQIYYWWSNSVQSKYQRHKDPIQSAIILLGEYEVKKCHLLMSTKTDALTAIAFSTPMIAHAPNVKEIHIDATYKTAKGRFELYAIVGQFQGSGFALGYLILDTHKDIELTKTTILTEFFNHIQNLGLYPEFIFTDKDFAEINAAKAVWRESHIQLCLWHIKKAIRTKIRSSKSKKNIALTADFINFPFIDPTFLPTTEMTETICTIPAQKEVLDIIQRHFHLHPLIPVDKNGTFLNADEIWKSSVREMYEFCRGDNNPRLWHYIYFSWYTKNRWELWARSCYPKIPFGKTNMIIESHWKVLKHDYLYRFHRPPLDYVVYVLCEKLLPAQCNRFYQLSHGRIYPHWWEDFKKEWKQCVLRSVDEHILDRYYVDSDKWICSCLSYLQNRFLICKHLVKAVGGTSNRLIYEDFRRSYQYPFLIWKPLENAESIIPDSSSGSATIVDERIERNEIELDDELPPITNEEFEKGMSELEEYLQHMREEFDAGNLRHVRTLMDASKKARNIIVDIKKKGKKRVRERTWKDSRPHTMFLPD